MLKSVIAIGVLAIAAPSLAAAQGNSNKTPAAQNANSLPFTANDPPAGNFNSKGLPAGFPPVPGCRVLALDKDDRNGPNGDDKNPGHGNPHCQPASP